jgi:hypothetical protein
MPRGIPNAKPDSGDTIEIYPAPIVAALEANKPKTVPVKLLRNYHPEGLVVNDADGKPVRDKSGNPVRVPNHEVIGYDRPRIEKKDAAGRMIVLDEGGFTREEDDQGKLKPMPPAVPGTGTLGKLFAGTLVRLPVDEAKRARKLGIVEYELDD